MEKLVRSFATEAHSGKDDRQLITDQPDCLAPEMTCTPLDNRRWCDASNRTSSHITDALVDDGGPPATNGTATIARLAIKVKGRVVFVNPLDMIVAKAEGNYVALVYTSGAYFVRETMATTERKLECFGFVRIHRSILVNATLVKDMRRNNAGTYVLRTTDGSEHPVGRAYKRNLKVIASSWLGVDLV